MDPYLERYWPDVHATFISLLRIALNNELPDDLIARSGERMEVLVEGDEWPSRSARVPDVSVSGEPSWSTGAASTAVADQIEKEPGVIVATLVEPLPERFVQIITPDREEVVTVIELLNPSKKSAAGWEEFRDKREAMLNAGANWVEIDLVREGDWRRPMGLVTVVGRTKSGGDPTDTPFRISIWNPSQRNRAYLFPIRLQDSLPSLAVPLRPGDPRVEVALQPLLDEVYRTGRYPRRIRYDRSPEPALTGADAVWAGELVANRTAT